MDIWRWVIETADTLRKEGDNRLAWLIYAIPSRTSDLKHAEVDALAVEAVALARAAKKPWLELYFRHWHMQSRVIHRHEVRDCLPEAVSLLDLASREDVQSCPQAVCVVQDLACTYADTDGPGYVEERLAVARETLGRIDASWPCWDCISGEYGSALQDAGRGDELLAFVEQQATAVHQANEEVGHNLKALRARALLLTGRPAEALEIAEAMEARAPSHTTTLKRDHLLARCKLALGRADDARAHIPALERVQDSPGYFDDWSEVVLEAVRAGALASTWGQAAAFTLMGRRLDRNGSLYKRALLWQRAAELLLRRGAARAASLLLDRVDRAQADLRRPEALRDAQLPLRAQLRALPEPAPLTTPDAPILEPDLDLDAAHAALALDPDSVALLHRASSALAALHLIEEAAQLLTDAFDRGLEDPDLLTHLGELLLEAGAIELLDASLDKLRQRTGPLAREATRLRARRLASAGRHAEALQLLTPLLGDDHAAIEPTDAYRAATLERLIGRPERALQLLLPQLHRVEPGPLEWEVAICATLTGDWATVRRAADRLGMTFDGEGPIDEPAHRCRLALDDAPNQLFHAVRTGPATARITQLTAPDQPHGERYLDTLVIDPTPLQPLQGDEDTPTFQALTTLHTAGWRAWTLDGLRPSTDTLDSLAQHVEDLGAILIDRTHPDYVLTPAGADAPQPALYALLAIPPDLTPQPLHRLLTDLLAGEQLLWPHLAIAAADPEAAQAHVELGQRLGV